MTKHLYLALAAAGALLLLALGLARCPAAAPVTPPAAIASPMPAAQAASISSTAATLENELEIIVPPRRHAPSSDGLKPSGHPEEPGGPPRVSAPDEEPIIIRIKQTATAAASSQASASIDHLAGASKMTPDHARLGAFIGTVPGAIALTYQVAAVEVPPWVLGTPLELGLEVEGNVQQLGGGVSVGGKAFATAGGYVGWNGPGWYLGLGMRF
ncbi:hypothetical protein D3C87_1148730 [compost metagenome]